jgi:hypothetical protein
MARTRFPKAKLFPVGDRTIQKVLPLITPDNLSALSLTERKIIKAKNPAILDLLNLMYSDYKRNTIVGSDAYLDFNMGAMVAHRFSSRTSSKPNTYSCQKSSPK